MTNFNFSFNSISDILNRELALEGGFAANNEEVALDRLANELEEASFEDLLEEQILFEEGLEEEITNLLEGFNPPPD